MTKNPLEALPGGLGNNLGEYLREQRLLAKLSVRQLSDLAGVSNPYLSQIERGVKRPSAEILQQIGRGLSISAETLYVQAGLLDPKDAAAEAGATTRAAIRTDPALTARQRQTLLEIYESFVGQTAAEADEGAAEPARPTPRARATRRAAKQDTSAARASGKASGASSSSGTSTSGRSSGGNAAGAKSSTGAKKKTSGSRKGAGSTTTSKTTRNTRDSRPRPASNHPKENS